MVSLALQALDFILYSDLSGMVADNEGSSPELAGGAQQEKGTREEGGVEERREEWRRGKEGKKEREKTEAGVGTQEKVQQQLMVVLLRKVLSCVLPP